MLSEPFIRFIQIHNPLVFSKAPNPMDLESQWQKALKETEIIRSRVQGLFTFTETQVPYILLSESTVNLGDTVVRSGEVMVEKPSLILPPHLPQFEGFEFDEKNQPQGDQFVNFLLVRGVSLPSLRYNNKTGSLDLYEDKLKSAIRHYKEILQSREDVHTGLIVGPEDCWQFSLLIFICSQVLRNSDADLRGLLDKLKGKKHEK